MDADTQNHLNLMENDLRHLEARIKRLEQTIDLALKMAMANPIVRKYAGKLCEHLPLS